LKQQIDSHFYEVHNQLLSEQWKIEHPFSVPLLNRIANADDVGTLAKVVVSENVADTKYLNKQCMTVQYDKEQHVLIVTSPAVAGLTLNPRLIYVMLVVVPMHERNDGRKKFCLRLMCQKPCNHRTCIRRAIMSYQWIGPMDIDPCIPVIKFEHWFKSKKEKMPVKGCCEF